MIHSVLFKKQGGGVSTGILSSLSPDIPRRGFPSSRRRGSHISSYSNYFFCEWWVGGMSLEGRLISAFRSDLTVPSIF